MKKIIILLMLATSTLLFSATKDPYTGYWMMPGEKFIIHIENIDGEYLGHVDWLKDKCYPKGDKMAGAEQIDRNNPNPSLRKRDVMGLQVVGDLHQEKNRLKGGWVYDSWNGKMYYGSAAVVDKNTLKLKGSLDRFGLLGYSMKAKRVNNPAYYNIVDYKKSS